MRSQGQPFVSYKLWLVASVAVFTAVVALYAAAQTDPHERPFSQSKAAVEKALTALQPNLAGRLPVLDGFAKPGEHPLDRYQRGYYQSTVQVSSTPSGGSLVRVSTKVTAWYVDPVASRSGYELLISNGRIEADLLDQLREQLANTSTDDSSKRASVSTPKSSNSWRPVVQLTPVSQTAPLWTAISRCGVPHRLGVPAAF